MNKVAAKIINTLLLASLLASYRDDAEDTNEYVYTIVSNNVDQLTKSNARVMKNVIKLGKNGKLTLIAGRRSHYSHRSHYSGRRSRCSSFHSVLEYTIGERTLTEGMYGSDVDMLVSILQGKGFKTNRIKKH